MSFKIIDRSVWKREEYFNHFLSVLPCTYSVTVQLDITKILNAGLKLYSTMLFCISKTVNAHEEFRMAINDRGEVGFFDKLNPCYTVFHKDSESFSNIWTEYADDYGVFCKEYDNDIALYGAIEKILAKPNAPENTFPVSMVPWISFEGFNLNLQKGYDYLIPIFTIGKYHCSGERSLIPLAVQVHHAVCDGFHASRFINELQALLNKDFNSKDLESKA